MPTLGPLTSVEPLADHSLVTVFRRHSIRLIVLRVVITGDGVKGPPPLLPAPAPDTDSDD